MMVKFGTVGASVSVRSLYLSPFPNGELLPSSGARQGTAALDSTLERGRPRTDGGPPLLTASSSKLYAFKAEFRDAPAHGPDKANAGP